MIVRHGFVGVTSVRLADAMVSVFTKTHTHHTCRALGDVAAHTPRRGKIEFDWKLQTRGVNSCSNQTKTTAPPQPLSMHKHACVKTSAYNHNDAHCNSHTRAYHMHLAALHATITGFHACRIEKY